MEEAAAAPPLAVVFVDETHEADPANPEGFTFGRGADLDIDSNPFLHRRVGRFFPDRGIWWIENLSPWTSLTVTGDGASALLPGQARAALVHTVSVVRFEAGSCNYELRALLPEAPRLGEHAPPPHDIDLTATYRPVSLPLTDDQRLLVVALAEHRLRDPHGRVQLPSNRELAERLGWSLAKFNRKLDWLCARLDRVGVSGMKASGRRANDRRQHLVDHMVTNQHVTASDLDLLRALPDRTDPTHAAREATT